MTIYLENRNQCVNTFGGEDENLGIKEYGIQIGDLTIRELTPYQMKSLGVLIINHLMANGHRVSIGQDVNGDYLKFND